MISTVDLFKEIKVIEDIIKKEQDPFKRATLKQNELIIKLLHNLRTNIVLVMDHLKIKKVRNEREDQTEKV